MNKKEKAVKTCLTTLFIIFIGLIVSNKNGYSEYEMHKKVELTNEQIEKFENDIKNNKNIDIDNYLKNITEDYSNNISTTCLNFSNTTSKYIKRGISDIFDILSKLLT